MISHKSMKNTIQTKLNINPKSLNSKPLYACMGRVYRVNSQEVKNGFQKLQTKRSFSKMPFFEMPYCTMIIYVLDNTFNICYHWLLN